ncbi:hypothetical protein FRX31_005060 [Thalictrum thalictroides]|uniref:Uncharacterized protein n=1 Tax=Thalictrum thalictroides TaxID=46969 RepID=A0A7J6XAC9_THATH|nr:hypothetical protein FRX31_005060 [Thalictrum thalictroides]
MKGFNDTLRNVEVAIKKLSLNIEPQNEDRGTTGVEAAYGDNILEPLLDPLAKKCKGKPKTFLNLIDKIKKKKTKASKKGLLKNGKARTSSKVLRKDVSQSNLNHAHGRGLAHENVMFDLNNSPQDPFV